MSFDAATFDPATFNPHDPAFLADPGPTYAWFRAHAPVAKVHVEIGGNVLYDAWWVFRHADVKAVLGDDTRFLKALPAAPDAPPSNPTVFGAIGNMPPGIFSMDPPRHDVLRPQLDAMLAQAIAQVPQTATQFATPLLQKAATSQRIELVSDYAMPLPSSVLMTVLGVPQGHWGGLMQWVDGIFHGNDFTAPISARLSAGTCAMAMSNYFQAMARGKPQGAGSGCPLHFAAGGMLDRMLDSRSAPQGISDAEFQQTSINLAVAGYLSTVFLIATGTLSLLKQPEQLALLKSRPELWPAAVHEMVRLDSPVQVTDRVAAQDTEIAGQAIRRGDRIGLVVGSANRDERVFADPERLAIQRDNGDYLGFGSGIHRCLGEPLALAVSPVAFRALFDAFPQLQLDGEPQWMTDPYLRSVANLPLRLG